MNGASAPLELVLPDRTRVAITGEVTLGRANGNSVRFTDPSVSRHHARISFDRAGTQAVLEDVGSSYGTWLDGAALHAPRALRDGAQISIGNQKLTVERRRDPAEAGRTIVVPPGQSVFVSQAAAGAPGLSATSELGARPRLRSGYALKRLEANEGPKRWVLKDLRSGRFLRLADADAELLELLDGRRSLPDLVREAEARHGAAGRVRLANLLTELAERGYLAGSAAAPAEPETQARGWRRLLVPREWAWPGAGELFERLYRGGGWMLLTRPALAVIGVLVLSSLVVFAYLLAGRYGTPFVVANKVGIGGLVFILGRLAIAAVHETAHGLTLASFGRRVQRAGLKLLGIVPYVFVDTSDAWFEPRRRRIAVSAAGPVSDFALGGVFSVCCLVVAAGTARDVFFQLAFAAYLGGLFNLNPFVERDGYHILVDALREPGLRRRAREQLAGRLRGRPVPESKVLARYSLLGVAWTVLAASFGLALSLRYGHELARFAPGPLVWGALAALWASFVIVVLVVIARPLRERAKLKHADAPV